MAPPPALPVPGNFEYPEFAGPSSSVITDPQGWQDSSVLIPHEPLRWLHFHMREVLKNFNPEADGNEWKSPLFFEWLSRYYIDMLHWHHDTEETIYNPTIVEHGGTMPPKLHEDHLVMLEDLTKIMPFQEKIETSGAAAVEEFMTFMIKLMDGIEEHITEEETTYPKLLRETNMTEKDHDEMVHKIMSSLGSDGLKTFVPMVVYCMHSWNGEEATEAFEANMPTMCKMALGKWWREDFTNNSTNVLEALKGDTPYKPKTSGCCTQ